MPPEHSPLCVWFRPLVTRLATALYDAVVQSIDDAVSEAGVGYSGRRRNRKWSSPRDVRSILGTTAAAINGDETRRIFESQRIVAHIGEEVVSASELHRIFADESADLRRIVARPIVVEAGLGI